MIKLKTHCGFPFGLRKGKTGHFCYQLRAIYFFNQFTNTRHREKNHFTFIVDRGWRERR